MNSKGRRIEKLHLKRQFNCTWKTKLIKKANF